ncbi:phenylalanine--tRNA ligase subunit alpha [Candidatus Berkiella cookevillensis]|uniref:Phenylalanine--tRNA ligase alpha subunit n=1 Tax=Candidatus Berkiella cookevillensis TaxID=437022 RepID=A0A0Q9Y9W3_9GAMM|nr:phenylalanine--tRNA ligase subunit alpha [Candidatus Berkiella cookevillensis]MCS5707976.1 phenylalanine--tRNA ligase subunit alpha [Candidatus Berkiella cookevillensis]
MEEIHSLLHQAEKEINEATDPQSLEHVRVKYLGKKGHFTEILKNLKNLSPEERKEVGKDINLAKDKFQDSFAQRKDTLDVVARNKQELKESIDVSLPGHPIQIGALHPISTTLERISQIFSQMGFHTETGPDIESEYYNFEALNIPEHHPARAMHDTFYFNDKHVLRTHTSPVQIRAMEKMKAPIRIIAPGKVYRCDSDVTHTPMFHQVEGLMLDEGIHFGHLKGILEAFLQAFFEEDVKTRFRASYFPFTEPSAEVDMSCVKCKAKGCRICKQTGWLEVLGCGMVHPKVLEYVKVDSEKYTGFAFGMGVERLTMLRYEVDDLRLFFENDIRVLKQFSGV